MPNSWSLIQREVERCAREVRLDRRDRPDLIQETLLRVWERVEAEGGERAVSGFVRTVLRRLRIDAWRRRLPIEGEPLGALEPQAPGAGPAHQAEVRDLARLLRQRVAELPEAQREVVRLRMEAGLTFREIAERQGVPLGTALGRMHLAMKRLRDELEAQL